MPQLERVIGHRGAAAYAPENTLSAFRAARALGARWVEFDVQLSSDGQAYLFHDKTLERTSTGQGEFSQSHTNYLKSLDYGAWFTKDFQGTELLTLKEALNWLNAHNMQANIEIKPNPGLIEQTTTAVLTEINRYWLQDELPLVSSFDHHALRLCRAIQPTLPLGLLLDGWDNQWYSLADELSCFSIHVGYRHLTKQRINEIKEKNYKICAYTVNRHSLAQNLFSAGVDAVFSDFPNLLNLSFKEKWLKRSRIKKTLDMLNASEN